MLKRRLLGWEERLLRVFVIILNREERAFSKVFSFTDLGIQSAELKKLYELEYEFVGEISSGTAKMNLIKTDIGFTSEGMELDFSPYQVYILKGEFKNQNFGSGFVKWVERLFTRENNPRTSS
jgi:hypothetical protein